MVTSLGIDVEGGGLLGGFFLAGAIFGLGSTAGVLCPLRSSQAAPPATAKMDTSNFITAPATEVKWIYYLSLAQIVSAGCRVNGPQSPASAALAGKASEEFAIGAYCLWDHKAGSECPSSEFCWGNAF